MSAAVTTYDEYLRTYRPDEWERQRRERLTPEQIAYKDAVAAIRAAAASICRHCGALPDPDGDHSCPCPYSDEDCPDHLAVTPSQDKPSTASQTAEKRSEQSAQTIPCRSGHTDCTVDCGWCKGTGQEVRRG